MKIKNPIKFIRSMVILVIIIFAVIAFFYNKSYAYREHNLKTVPVSSGDTLWTIAEFEKENNDYYKNKDIREIIYEIKKINNLDSSNLIVGQELKI